MKKEEERIKEWIRIARIDWERSKRNLREMDVYASGFFLQQCLKNTLKPS